MIKPVTPDEIEADVTKPDEVIQVFNELILKYWDGKQAVIKEADAARLISSRMNNIGTKVIYNNHWLNIEPVYAQAGWKVEYDKPGYNESYPTTFTFSRTKI